MSTLGGRARTVLGRFPRHLEATSPGKLIGAVAQALVRDQDVQAADLQGIRLAHRLRGARELTDLLGIASLHGVGRAELGVLFARHAEARARLAALEANVDAEGDLAERELLASALLALWSLLGTEPVRLFSEDPEGSDPIDVSTVAARIVEGAVPATRTRVLLDAIRARIATTAFIHARGNGTVSALLRGAANALDLELGPISHSDDRYWHAAPVHDRLRIGVPSEGAPLAPIDPGEEYLGIEENPHAPAARGPDPRRHGELFHYIRKGFDDALLEIRVTGIGNRTVAPMVVNRDAGHGVGVSTRIPDGDAVVFTQQGRVLLGGADITSRAYVWRGACFAETGAKAAGLDAFGDGAREVDDNDFAFADAALGEAALEDDPRTARFAVVTPAGSLDRDARFPHAGASLEMPSIGIGKTRFAFFVQAGHFSARLPEEQEPPGGSTDEVPEDTALAFVPDPDPFAGVPASLRSEIRLVTARHGLGRIDASVFAGAAGEPAEASARVALHWLERQAYTVCVFLPGRFRGFDGSDGAVVRERVRNALGRFRPAGITVHVDFVEDEWVLGRAALPVGEGPGADPISQVQASTRLPAPEEG